MTSSPSRGDISPFDIAPALDGGEWSGTQKRIIALIACAIVLDGFDNQVLGFTVPLLLREWQTTRGALAPVFALGFVGMVLGTILGGALGDRVGRRPALIASVLLFGVATGVTALVHSVTELAICRIVAGFGLGGAMPVAATLLAEFAPARKRSMAVTLGIVCIPLGGVIGGLIATRILPVTGWRALFMIGGAAPLVVAGLLVALLPESPRFLVRRPERHAKLARLLTKLGHEVDPNGNFIDSHDASRGASASIGRLFGSEWRLDTAALWIAFFSCLLTTYLVFSWAPALLAQVGFNIATSSLGLAIFNLGGVAGALGAASLMPRLGSRPVMLTMAGGGVAGAAFIAILPAGATGAPLLLLALAIEGGFINAAQTCLYALSAQIYPAALRSTGVGAAAGIGRTGAIMSSFVGAAILAGGWSSYFATLGFGMTVTFVALAVIRNHLKGAGPAQPVSR
jgi:AAHS family 4-hydroxybenzoate transporter-like MFS transporter